MTTISDLAFLAVVASAIAIAAWLFSQRKREYRLRAGEHQCEEAWLDLQWRCMRLVEQDELGGADQEKLHLAAAYYRNVICEGSRPREAIYVQAEGKHASMPY